MVTCVAVVAEVAVTGDVDGVVDSNVGGSGVLVAVSVSSVVEVVAVVVVEVVLLVVVFVAALVVDVGGGNDVVVVAGATVVVRLGTGGSGGDTEITHVS